MDEQPYSFQFTDTTGPLYYEHVGDLHPPREARPMNDLVAFIRTRLDADQQVAKQAAEPFRHGDRTGLNGLHSQLTNHVLRHNSARVLAEVAAKRRILERHPGATNVDECPGCGANLDGTWRTPPGSLCPEQVDMALPYADHPDYRQEWRPDA